MVWYVGHSSTWWNLVYSCILPVYVCSASPSRSQPPQRRALRLPPRGVLPFPWIHFDTASSVHGRTTPMNQTIASYELAINVLIQVSGLV